MIWAMGQDPKNAIEMPSACIFTTRPNAVMTPLHNRMPVILDPDQVDAWLDPTLQDAIVDAAHTYLNAATGTPLGTGQPAVLDGVSGRGVERHSETVQRAHLLALS